LIALDVLALARRFNEVVVVAVPANAVCGRIEIAALADERIRPAMISA
jgi:hypothetical protein